MTTAVEATRTIRENIARAKGALRREELARTLFVTADALDLYGKIKVVGAVRFELEVNLDEMLGDICRHTAVFPMLPPGPDGKPFILRFVRGKEAILAAALRRMCEILEKKKAREEEEEIRKVEHRRQDLLEKGQAFLDAGDIPKARALLRRVADEFCKTEGLCLNIAERYRKADLPQEAAEIYELLIENFPKDSTGWTGAIDMYMEMGEYEKVEKLYTRVLQQFGQHPRTLCNIAAFYLQWRRKGKAAEFALRALRMQPDFLEAQEILNMAEGKG